MKGFDENTVNKENKTPLDYVHYRLCSKKQFLSSVPYCLA